MPPASPRKSSTSSGRPERLRARYLGIEVAGEPVPTLRPLPWGPWLRDALATAGAAELPFRLIRSEGRRAVVKVGRADVGTARRAWNTLRSAPGGRLLCTRRTWGTLVGAKRWLDVTGTGAHVPAAKAQER